MQSPAPQEPRARADAAVWICRPPPATATPLAAPRLLLFCVPQAGMGAWVYHSWAPRLAALGVEVLPLELPGRNSRRREPPATNLLQLAADIADVVAAHVTAVEQAEAGSNEQTAAATAAAAAAAVAEGHTQGGAAGRADGAAAGPADAGDGSGGGTERCGGSSQQLWLRQRRRRMPYALFGHSMGGWVVYEVAQCLVARAAAAAAAAPVDAALTAAGPTATAGGASAAAAGDQVASPREGSAGQMAAAVPAEPGAIHLPAHVFVSGIRAPHLSAAGHDLEPTRLHTLADPDAFWAAFTQRYGNTNPLLADPRVRQLVWPVLRADFQLAETYVMPVGRNTPLPVPLTVFGGELDGRYTREQLEAWRHHVALAAPSASHPAAASSSFSPAAAPGWRLVLLPGVGHDYVEKWQQQEQQQKQKQQEKKLQGPGAGDGGGGLGGAGLIAELEAALAAAVLAAEEAPGCY